MKPRAQRAERRLLAWLERSARRRSGMPVPQVLVRSSGREFTFGDVAQPFHSASVGKVMAATLMAMLVERGVKGQWDFPVNSVSPGYVRTALVDEYFSQHPDPDAETQATRTQPLGRLGDPAEIAEVVCFLASSAASFVTGANWSVDGGLSSRFA